LSIYHPVTTLRVGDFLSAQPADLAAHVTIHDAPDEWHRGNIVVLLQLFAFVETGGKRLGK